MITNYSNLFPFVNKVIPLKALVLSRKMEKYLSFRSTAKVLPAKNRHFREPQKFFPAKTSNFVEPRKFFPVKCKYFALKAEPQKFLPQTLSSLKVLN